tara:strand:- start:333 stop:518 length:186 start_codon:yes stop_codon:yes gene_type:complete
MRDYPKNLFAVKFRLDGWLEAEQRVNAETHEDAVYEATQPIGATSAHVTKLSDGTSKELEI